jgi:hypothetical protein
VLDTLCAYNLIGRGGSGGITGGFNHNLVGVDPLLGPLQDNGGPTQTMALLDGSPAFNAGNSALLAAGVTTDQRGRPRLFAGDTIPVIGAFESQVVRVKLIANPIVPGATAIGINASTKNNVIVIKPGPAQIGALAIRSSPTTHGISVTLNGVKQGTFFPTSRDVFIAAGKGVNRVLIEGALARTVKLHAITGTLHVTRISKAGSVHYTLEAHPSNTPQIPRAAVVEGPLTTAKATFLRRAHAHHTLPSLAGRS